MTLGTHTICKLQDYKEICLMIAWLGSSIGFAFHNSSFFPMEIDSTPQLCNRVDTGLELPSANGTLIALRFCELKYYSPMNTHGKTLI